LRSDDVDGPDAGCKCMTNHQSDMCL